MLSISVLLPFKTSSLGVLTVLLLFMDYVRPARAESARIATWKVRLRLRLAEAPLQCVRARQRTLMEHKMDAKPGTLYRRWRVQ